MEIDLEVRARSRGGWFSRGDAVQCGYEDRDLAIAVKRGELLRLRQGAYVSRSAYEERDPTQQHLLLARAALARQGGEVALTGHSAAAAHGLVLHDVDLTTVHLLRLDNGAGRREAGVVHHLACDDIADQIVIREGLPVVNVSRTVWELASGSSLLAGVCAADSALRLYPECKTDISALTKVFAQRPGSRRARLVLRLADGRSESAGESFSRLLFFRTGFPKPELQHKVVDVDGRLLAVCDFYWPKYRHVGEFDGLIKYGRLLADGQSAADVVVAEKRREDAVRGQILGMSRWIWAEMMPSGEQLFLRRLHRELEQSGRLYATRFALA